MPSQNAPSTTRRPSTRGSCLLRSFLAFVAVAVIFGFLALVVTAVGQTRGVEFSPDTFARRQFSYYRLPLLKWQITPIRRTNITGDFEKKLAGRKLIGSAPAKTNTRTWHLVYEQAGAGGPIYGDASILCTYLDMYNIEGKLVWQQWTDDHPKLASIFWPAVAEVARNELYIWIPDLMNLPKGIDDPAILKAELNDFLVDHYTHFAKEQQQRSRHELAVELLDQALKHEPDNAELQRLRAESSGKLDADSQSSPATNPNSSDPTR